MEIAVVIIFLLSNRDEFAKQADLVAKQIEEFVRQEQQTKQEHSSEIPLPTIEGVEIEQRSWLPIRVLTRQVLAEDGLRAVAVGVIGPWPEDFLLGVCFVTSVFDCKDGTLLPVLSSFGALQEPSTQAYMFQRSVPMLPERALSDGLTAGFLIPEVMVGPYGGQREVLIVVRLVDTLDVTGIRHGCLTLHLDDVLWTVKLKRILTFESQGYLERAHARLKAHALAIRIAFLVAHADGSVDDSELAAIEAVVGRWKRKASSIYDGLAGEQGSEFYASVTTDALRSLHANQHTLPALLAQLRRTGDRVAKQEAIQLCFDVMAADGVADLNELRIIAEVAEKLGLDPKEVERLRDRKIVGLDVESEARAGIEDLLGVKPDWDAKTIRRHLQSEFRKWNSRLNSLPEGKKRENAQRMLDMIGKAYKKYS